MNNQKLIKKWESKEGVPSYEISAFPVNPSLNEMYIAGYGVARKEILDDLKQLDEPKKVVVPKFVAEWIEYAKKKGDSLSASFKPWDLYGAEYGKVNSWIKDNEETYARAWLDGYEVEEDPLYYVKLPGVGYLNNADGGIKHTDKEIKAIDERYWPFAVKVDGEQMKYKTKYSSIVPKGQIGECIDKVDGELLALLIKFGNGEVFWFMKRDLIEVEDK